MADVKISQLSPKGLPLDATDLLEVSVYNGLTYNSFHLTGAEIINASALTVGTTPISSGSVGGILFQGTGNVVQEDTNFIWDNTNKRLGLGATPSTSVRLDVRAQGALSTDIALRVRNSANTADILNVNGKGQVWANGTGAIASNTAFGEMSLNSLTSATGNTAFGFSAIKANLTGTGLTAFGNNALLASTGAGNTAVGNGAGQSNVGGTNNTYLGYSAGQNGTTAVGSVFIGYAAGQSSNAQYGVFIGQSASTTGGNGTVAIGYSAGAGTGTYNISIGQSAGFGMTIGGNNIHIGYRTVASGITTGTNNTIIGGNSVVGAVSNNVAISDGAGNKVLWFNSVNAMVSDLKIDTVTGIKIGTATTNKLAFWNATPIVQPTTATTPATVVSGTGGNVKHDDTFDGYTVEKVVRALRNTGILA